MLIFLFLFLIFAGQVNAQNLKITDYSSEPNPEWIEITNQKGEIVDLKNWSLGDSNTQVIYDIGLSGCLSVNGTIVITSNSLLNNEGDVITLYNQSTPIDVLTYTTGQSKAMPASTNTCIPSPTPTVPSPIPTQTASPTTVPTATNTPGPTSTATSSPTRTPTPTIKISPSPTEIPLPTETIFNPPTPTDDPQVLPTPSDVTSDSAPVTVSKTSSNSSWLPLIFMVVGLTMLAVPFLIIKFKK